MITRYEVFIAASAENDYGALLWDTRMGDDYVPVGYDDFHVWENTVRQCCCLSELPATWILVFGRNPSGRQPVKFAGKCPLWDNSGKPPDLPNINSLSFEDEDARSGLIKGSVRWNLDSDTDVAFFTEHAVVVAVWSDGADGVEIGSVPRSATEFKIASGMEVGDRRYMLVYVRNRHGLSGSAANTQFHDLSANNPVELQPTTTTTYTTVTTTTTAPMKVVFEDTNEKRGYLDGYAIWTPPQDVSMYNHWEAFIAYDEMGSHQAQLWDQDLQEDHVPVGTNQMHLWSATRARTIKEGFPANWLIVYARLKSGYADDSKVVESMGQTPLYDESKSKPSKVELDGLSFVDTALGPTTVGGTIEWRPVLQEDYTLIVNFMVYIAETADGQNRVFVAEMPRGTNQFIVTPDMEAAGMQYVLVYGQNQHGEADDAIVATITSSFSISTSTTEEDAAAASQQAESDAGGVREVSFTDTNAEAGVIGGKVVWEPPVDQADIQGYQVFIAFDEQGTHGAQLWDQEWESEVPVGVNFMNVLEGTRRMTLEIGFPANWVLVFIMKSDGLQPVSNAGKTTLYDEALIPAPFISLTGPVFEDIDHNSGTIGGVFSWSPAPMTDFGLFSAFVVYLSTTREGDGLLFVKRVPRWKTELELPNGTTREGRFYMLLYTENSHGRSTSAAPVIIQDLGYFGPTITETFTTTSTTTTGPLQPVSAVAFADLDAVGGILGGTIQWTAPSDVSLVTHYFVYIAFDDKNAHGARLHDKDMGDLIPVGTNQMNIYPGTIRRTMDTGFPANWIVVESFGGEGTRAEIVSACVRLYDESMSPPPSTPLFQVVFVDTDPVGGKIGGVVSWEIGARADLGFVQEISVYASLDAQGSDRTLLGIMPPDEDHMDVTTGTTSAGKQYILIYARNKNGDSANPVHLLFVDAGWTGPTVTDTTTITVTTTSPPIRGVSGLTFVDTNPTADVIDGVVEWTPPEHTEQILGYLAYMAFDAQNSFGVQLIDQDYGDDVIPTGINRIELYEGTSRGTWSASHPGNWLLVFITTVSGLQPVTEATKIRIVDKVAEIPPPASLEDLSFWDEDPANDSVGGVIRWRVNPNQDLGFTSHFEAYLSDSDGEETGPLLGIVPVEDDAIAVPSGTSSGSYTHIAIYAANSNGKASSGVAVEFQHFDGTDLVTRTSTTITTTTIPVTEPKNSQGNAEDGDDGESDETGSGEGNQEEPNESNGESGVGAGNGESNADFDITTGSADGENNHEGNGASEDDGGSRGGGTDDAYSDTTTVGAGGETNDEGNGVIDEDGGSQGDGAGDSYSSTTTVGVGGQNNQEGNGANNDDGEFLGVDADGGRNGESNTDSGTTTAGAGVENSEDGDGVIQDDGGSGGVNADGSGEDESNAENPDVGTTTIRNGDENSQDASGSSESGGGGDGESNSKSGTATGGDGESSPGGNGTNEDGSQNGEDNQEGNVASGDEGGSGIGIDGDGNRESDADSRTTTVGGGGEENQEGNGGVGDDVGGSSAEGNGADEGDGGSQGVATDNGASESDGGPEGDATDGGGNGGSNSESGTTIEADGDGDGGPSNPEGNGANEKDGETGGQGAAEDGNGKSNVGEGNPEGNGESNPEEAGANEGDQGSTAAGSSTTVEGGANQDDGEGEAGNNAVGEDGENNQEVNEGREGEGENDGVDEANAASDTDAVGDGDENKTEGAGEDVGDAGNVGDITAVGTSTVPPTLSSTPPCPKSSEICDTSLPQGGICLPVCGDGSTVVGFLACLSSGKLDGAGHCLSNTAESDFILNVWGVVRLWCELESNETVSQAAVTQSLADAFSIDISYVAGANITAVTGGRRLKSTGSDSERFHDYEPSFFHGRRLRLSTSKFEVSYALIVPPGTDGLTLKQSARDLSFLDTPEFLGFQLSMRMRYQIFVTVIENVVDPKLYMVPAIKDNGKTATEIAGGEGSSAAAAGIIGASAASCLFVGASIWCLRYAYRTGSGRKFVDKMRSNKRDLSEAVVVESSCGGAGGIPVQEEGEKLDDGQGVETLASCSTVGIRSTTPGSWNNAGGSSEPTTGPNERRGGMIDCSIPRAGGSVEEPAPGDSEDGGAWQCIGFDILDGEPVPAPSPPPDDVASPTSPPPGFSPDFGTFSGSPGLVAAWPQRNLENEPESRSGNCARSWTLPVPPDVAFVDPLVPSSPPSFCSERPYVCLPMKELIGEVEADDVCYWAPPPRPTIDDAAPDVVSLQRTWRSEASEKDLVPVRRSWFASPPLEELDCSVGLAQPRRSEPKFSRTCAATTGHCDIRCSSTAQGTDSESNSCSPRSAASSARLNGFHSASSPSAAILNEFSPTSRRRKSDVSSHLTSRARGLSDDTYAKSHRSSLPDWDDDGVGMGRRCWRPTPLDFDIARSSRSSRKGRRRLRSERNLDEERTPDCIDVRFDCG